MSDNEASLLKSPTRTPWNRGKLIGAKPPLRQGHVWSIRTRLQLERRLRDLALQRGQRLGTLARFPLACLLSVACLCCLALLSHRLRSRFGSRVA